MKGARVLGALVALTALLAVVAPASAQFGPFGPGGTIISSQTAGQVSVTTPSGSAQTLMSQAIGTGAFSGPVSFHGRGYISGQPSSPGTLTLSVKLGTGTSQQVIPATTIEVGGATGKTAFELDCDWNQINTGTTAVALTTSLAQQCRAMWMPAGTTTPKFFPPGATTANANPITTTISLTTTQTLLIQVTMSNTSAGTGIVLQDWRVVQGY